VNYKDTLNLPKTEFPMKANLVEREPQLLARWDEERLYDRIQQSREGQPPYLLHDGPPYANGHIHMGHALNKILKDFVVKSKTMQGRRAPYVPGWDCHGLPIEHQVMKELGGKKHTLNRIEIRQRCREYAEKFIRIQREEFKRLGVFGDWDRPYLTMSNEYEAAILREFAKVVESGGVYKRKKPVLWCPYDETALAEAEVEYEEHTSPSIYAKFRITGAMDDDDTQKDIGPPPNLFLLIWTTTPWTLPANQAVAVHPLEPYVLVQVSWKGKKETWILAEKPLKTSMEKFGLKDYKVVEGPYRGDQLSQKFTNYDHPFLSPPIRQVMTADFVTIDQGTGCVHIAPGHGQEDYQLYDWEGGENGPLKIVAPVDNQGRFMDEVGVPELVGKQVFKANDAIIQLLEDNNALIKHETLTHSYPHCWRCKNPVIFRATEQWFISMGDGEGDPDESLRGRAVNAIQSIAGRNGWIPAWGKDRILGMIQTRPDWCISRQRAWGAPIPVFRCKGCNELLIDPAVIRKIADRMLTEGGDLWFKQEASGLIPTGTRCAQCKSGSFEKEQDILDVWFDSGVSHAAVLKTRSELSWPADLYLEGSDQHRGWFHSSLLIALKTDGRPPYEAVLTHGFVVDGEGKKMSKSAGNVVAPQEVIQKYGAEVLRLWVAATDFREDVRISQEILSHLVEAYRKIRNTSRFLLGNLYDYEPPPGNRTPEGLTELDRWAMHRLQRLIERVRAAYDGFEFHTVFHSLNQFSAVDLSAVYLDILKDRLYTSRPDSPERRAAQWVLHRILHGMIRLMAPILSFTAEELWGRLPASWREQPSIHLCRFPEVDARWVDEDLSSRWDRLWTVRGEVAKVLEGARNQKRIGASQDAKVVLYAKAETRDLLDRHASELAALFIVSEAEVRDDGRVPDDAYVSTEVKDLAITVAAPAGAKCGRCWFYRPSVGSSDRHPTLCGRCAAAIP
jgi:isoleucyl-tRNA synthetase